MMILLLMIKRKPVDSRLFYCGEIFDWIVRFTVRGLRVKRFRVSHSYRLRR